MNNYALYYPTIEFQNYEWLWRASLLWDRIYRIVPSDYTPHDCDNVTALSESGEIGISLDPGNYAKTVGAEFLEKLGCGVWDAAALDDDSVDEFRQVHEQKVDYVLREMIIAEGHASQQGKWLSVPTHFAAHYMTYLANHMAERNNLQVLSDNSAAWAGSTYFRLDGEVEDWASEDFEQHLALLVVRDFLPDCTASIAPDKIIKFRDDFREERQRFMASLRDSAKEISECSDASIITDMTNDLQKDINRSLKDLQDSFSSLNVKGLTGMKSLTFPVLTNIATTISGNPLDPVSTMIMYAGGAALGLISGLNNRNQEKKKLLKGCDYSYLMHLDRNWKSGWGSDKDYSYYLYRKMEEFIND